jgi:importin-7
LRLPHCRLFGRLVDPTHNLVNNSIKPKLTWNLLKTHIPNLIEHVVFPLLCLTQDDLELWEEDPGEYIHKKIGTNLDNLRLMQDVYDEYLYPDIAAGRFLTQLASKRQKSCFTTILQFINTTLSLYDP